MCDMTQYSHLSGVVRSAVLRNRKHHGSEKLDAVTGACADATLLYPAAPDLARCGKGICVTGKVTEASTPESDPSMMSWLRGLYHGLRKRRRSAYLQGLVRRGMRIGKNVEIVDAFFFDPSHCFLISIGDNCTLAPNVRLIAHDASSKRLIGGTRIGRIDIGENCFIGDSVIVLPNVSIGAHCIVGAGSVVTRSIPAGMVAAGNPARIICPVAEYRERVTKLRDRKGIFGVEFYIEQLDECKMQQVLSAVEEGVALIE